MQQDDTHTTAIDEHHARTPHRRREATFPDFTVTEMLIELGVRKMADGFYTTALNAFTAARAAEELLELGDRAQNDGFHSLARCARTIAAHIQEESCAS